MDKGPTLWLVNSSPTSKRLAPRTDVPDFAIPFLRPNDVVLIPEGSGREFADFCREILEVRDAHVVIIDTSEPGSQHIDASDVTKDVVARINAALTGHAGDPVPLAKVLAFVSSASLEAAASSLPGKPTVLADRVRDVRAFGVRPVLHRRVKTIETEESLAERLQLDVRVSRGMVCEDIDDLLVAYRLLGLPDAAITPTAAGADGSAIVSSTEELRQYDFPLGPVILSEVLELDRGVQGTGVSVAYYFHGSECVGAAQLITVSNTFFGCRTPAISDTFDAAAKKASAALVGACKPKGISSVVFGMVEGEPVLTSAHWDAGGLEYFATLFMSRFFPQSAQQDSLLFFAWPTQLARVDVWTFWARLCEQGAALNPLHDRRGVFPLVLNRGATSFLIAIATSDEDLMALKDIADAALHEETEAAPLKLESWVDSNRRIWCNGPRPEYSRQTQRYNMPARTIPLVRKGLDYIVLPGGYEPIREFAEFVRSVFDLEDDQILWTPGEHYLLDDDIAKDPSVVARLKQVIVQNSSDKFTLLPYAVTNHFQEWSNQLSELGVSVFGETIEWISKFGHKGILHPAAATPDRPSPLTEMGLSVPVPRGWYCTCNAEIMFALKRLREDGVGRVVIKPVFGAAGEGIVFPTSDEQINDYHFPMGPVNLEEYLDLDRAPDGVVLSPAVHYMEGKLTGEGMVDQIMVGTGYAGWRQSLVPKAFQVTATKTVEALLRKIKPRGPGGFDFLSVKGKPVLTDVNTGRFNGAHAPKLFVDIHAPHKSWHCWKRNPNVNSDLWKFWKLLRQKGIAFDKNAPGGPMGVFPLIFMRGLSGQYIAVANTPEEAQAMEPIANECLEASIGTKPAPRRGTISVFKRADIARSRRWRRVWVQSPQPELLGNHTDPFVHQLPLLAAPILRPGMDLVVLPSSEAVLEHWSFVKQTLGLADNQVLLVATPPNVAADVHAVPRLDDYMDANIIDDLLARLKDSHARANSSVVAAAARQLARKNIESLTPSSSHPTLPDMAARKDAPGTLAAAALEKKMELLPPSSPPGGTHAAPMDFGYTLVPSNPGQAFRNWADSLVNQGMRVFGDQADWLLKFATRSILHRDIDDPDTPCLIESWGLPVKAPRGYVCKDRAALLKAWRQLDCAKCLLRPCRLMYIPWEGVIAIDREFQLRLYDFSHGPVVLEVATESASSGAALTAVPCLGNEPLGTGCVDNFRVGRQVTGVRSSAASPAAQETMLTAARKFLAVAKPAGPCTLVFAARPAKGADAPPEEIRLVDVQVGFFGREHFISLWLEEHAPPDCAFHAFQIPAPEDLDVWALWARLTDDGIAMPLGAVPESGVIAGVYPLAYERGTASLLLAVAPTPEDVRALKDKAIEAINRPVELRPLPPLPWAGKNTRRAIIAGRTPAESCFALALSRPDLDIAVLPAPDSVPASHASYRGRAASILRLDPSQVIEAGDSVLSADSAHASHLDAAAVALRGAILNTNLGSRERFVLCPPDARTTAFRQWASALSDLPVGIHAEDDDLWDKYGAKRMLYRDAPTDAGAAGPSVVETIATEAGIEIRVARGFSCRDADGLLRAHAMLGGGACVVRPRGVHTLGEGFVLVDDPAQLTLLDWASYPDGFVIEELLQIDRSKNGVGRSFIIPFKDGKVRASLAQDKITVGHRVAGVRPSGAGKRLLDRATKVAEAIVNFVKPRTVGAVHFHSVKSKPVLAGFTLGALDLYHVGTCFADEHGPAGCRTSTWSFVPPPEATADAVFGMLEKKALTFNPGSSSRGIFPLAFVPGDAGICVLVAIASSPLDAALLLDRGAAIPMDLLKAARGIKIEPSLVRESPRLRSGGAVDLLVVRGADGLFTPEPSVHRNVVIGGGKVLGIVSDEDAAAWAQIPGCQTLDATGQIICPGFVDCHVHITGGGGEAGPATRTPEAKLSELINGGITTVVGISGTDGISRSLQALLAKTRALNEEGITAFMWTGAYACPPPTITGSPDVDVMTVEQIIGAGEIAVSDHRGSQPTRQELARLAAQCRVAGMLSNKCGLVHVHMGPGKDLLAPLWDVVNNTDIPITQFHPTHMDRSEELINDGVRWLEQGGILDITGRTVRSREALKLFYSKGLLKENVTISSDSCGSLPTFDSEGRLVAYRSADTKALLRIVRDLYFADRWPLERILPMLTSTPAKLLKLKGKGRLQTGMDADLLLMSSTNLKLKGVVAKGRVMKGDGWTAGGVFEKASSSIRPHVPMTGV